eukprot:5764413-Heterocapsa_arctica.AAC.1
MGGRAPCTNRVVSRARLDTHQLTKEENGGTVQQSSSQPFDYSFLLFGVRLSYPLLRLPVLRLLELRRLRLRCPRLRLPGQEVRHVVEHARD